MKHHSVRPIVEAGHIIIYLHSLAKALALKTARTTKESRNFIFSSPTADKNL